MCDLCWDNPGQLMGRKNPETVSVCLTFFLKCFNCVCAIRVWGNDRQGDSTALQQGLCGGGDNRTGVRGAAGSNLLLRRAGRSDLRWRIPGQGRRRGNGGSEWRTHSCVVPQLSAQGATWPCKCYCAWTNAFHRVRGLRAWLFLSITSLQGPRHRVNMLLYVRRGEVAY